MYHPNALSEQLKAEARRSPAVRLGGGVYGANTIASVRRDAEKNRAGTPDRSGGSDIQGT